MKRKIVDTLATLDGAAREHLGWAEYFARYKQDMDAAIHRKVAAQILDCADELRKLLPKRQPKQARPRTQEWAEPPKDI